MRRIKPFNVARILVLVALAVALFGFLVKGLWNWLVPPIFGWQAITYWQGIGLLILSKILFGGFRGGPGGRRGMDGGWRGRWEKMSDEERERFRTGMRRWGPFEPPIREDEEKDEKGAPA